MHLAPPCLYACPWKPSTGITGDLVRYTFLLICEIKETPSFHNLSKALNSLGELRILPNEEVSLPHLLRHKYDMVIVDVTALDNEMLLISKILKTQLTTRVVVLTASPTWRRAREAIQAGAIDYISKSMNEHEYILTFQRLLGRKISH
jgi:DNA-binding NtrC family response regulator